MVQYRLRKNIRNARPIFDLVSQHYRSTDKGEIKPCGPEGREVERLSYSTDREMQNCVGEALSRYITREGIASKDVVVLTPKRLDRSNLLGLKLPTGLQMVRLEDQNLANQVACSTIHSFKGLERKIVLVAELDDELFQLAAEERASRCYVAFSRAQSHLAVVATPSVLKRLALPQ
jgi:superfamily I DNA/RNA helicase